MTGGGPAPRVALTVVPLALALLTGCGTAGASGPRAATGAPSTPSTASTPTTPTPPTPTQPTPSTAPPRASVPAPPSSRPGTPDHPSPRPSPDRVRGPDLSRRPAPSADGGRTGTTSVPTFRTPKAAPRSSERPTRPTIRIGTWSAHVVRGGQDEVDACRDAVQWAGPEIGTENGYEMRTAVIVGHDICGFDRFATLPVGTTVTISGPRGTWRYEVYAHYVTPGRGAPAAGLYWGDVTLQSCVGPDTGFSYLARI
ncbi:hypothetical protein ABT121_44860 [Streptomyces sp. NPDC001928]|uniref:hypothetical protein n=1 Tax=Streptomyces sp. NPDC001928 TaxID=3154404 RepID=UPI00332FB98E